MKRKIITIMLIILTIITGCKNNNNQEIKDNLIKKLSNLNSYELSGKLEIINNTDAYNYQVTVDYKKENYYKVTLKNLSSNHEQIILKNSTGVYVITPSLNKSYKFESNWPNNTSSIYLLNTILNDLENSKETTINKQEDYYIINHEINYPNNTSLTHQKIYLDQNENIIKIEALNEDEIALMTLNIEYIDYKKDNKIEDFEINNIIVEDNKTETKTSSTIDPIYPLYIPTGTVLKDEEKVSKTDGERIILTFSGEKPFTLIEETINSEDEFTIIPTYGEPYMVIDTVGSISENSINWISNGYEYYIVSDVLNQNELLNIAKSVNIIKTLK